MLNTPIQPRRAAHLQPGDIVKLHPLDRRRVLAVAPVEGAPVFVAGTWEVLTFSRPTSKRSQSHLSAF